MRVRLVDVAEHVGVSSKSVSNVVNGTGYVSAPVRERILAAIDELGYRPNLAARQLRSGRNGLLALVVPDLREPYFAEFSAQFVATAERRGFTTLVSQTGGSHARELAMIAGQGLPALDGIIMSPLTLSAKDVSEHRSASPIVVIGEEAQSLAGADIHHIGVDNAAAAAAATNHLLSLGRRRIAAVGVQESGPSATARLRFEGYRAALDAAGIDVDPALCIPVQGFNRAEGSLAVEHLIESGADFDAVFCFNDTLALGALYTLGARAVRVPDAVAVMGFDGIEEGRFTNPGFSTVDPGIAAMCAKILEILDEDERSPGAHHDVPFEIISR